MHPHQGQRFFIYLENFLQNFRVSVAVPMPGPMPMQLNFERSSSIFVMIDELRSVITIASGTALCMISYPHFGV
jgi:hypothetical protein